MIKPPIYMKMTEDEKKVGNFLSGLNLLWIHQAPVIVMDEEYKKRVWSPNFYLYDLGIYIEILDEEKQQESNIKRETYKLNKLPVVFVESYKEEKRWKYHVIRQILRIQGRRNWALQRNLFKLINRDTDVNAMSIITQKEYEFYNEHLDTDQVEQLVEIKKESEESEKAIYAGKGIKEIRKKYPRAYHHWTDKENTLLLNLHESGKKIKELSDLFERQPSAIRSRLKKIEEKSDVKERTINDSRNRRDKE